MLHNYTDGIQKCFFDNLRWLCAFILPQRYSLGLFCNRLLFIFTSFSFCFLKTMFISVSGPDGDALTENSFTRLIRGDPIHRLVPCPDSIGSQYKCQVGYKTDYEGANPDDLKRILIQRIALIRYTEFYHSWNRNIVPSSLESWEALT